MNGTYHAHNFGNWTCRFLLNPQASEERVRTYHETWMNMNILQPDLVTVMMPAYNAEGCIGHAIESVRGQSYPHWELVVVNDGSSDHTAEIVSAYADARIQLIHQANGGEAAARNTALRNTRGEFLAFLDADDAYLPDHLEVTVGYLQVHSEKAAVYTDGYYCDQKGTRLSTLQSRRRGPFEGWMFEEVVRGSDALGPPICVVLRSDVIERHGLRFDTDIVIGPDWDFFAQYSELAGFGYLDEKTCLYRISLTSITNRVGLKKRALELAKCRMKAINMTSFNQCSLATREAVFYDLLVNLLRGYPERQTDITQWPQFLGLSGESQSRLLRLMASHTLVFENDTRYVRNWLGRSRELNPSDRTSAFLYTIFLINPRLCRLLTRIRKMRQADPLNIPPFSDIKLLAS
jgi:glycosyltransferase involved in cell wall biosynthesis